MHLNEKKLCCEFLVEFLEVAIYGLIKQRNIYPDVIFVPKQKYGNVVYDTVHPQLKEYLYKFLQAVYQFAIDDKLSTIVVCFFDDTVVTEKVIFDLIPVVISIYNGSDIFLLSLERTFRSYFKNFNLFESTSNVNELKFLLQIYTTTSNCIQFLENVDYKEFPWMEVSSTSNNYKIKDAELIPFNIDRNEFINMQIYIEKPIGPIRN